MALRSLTTVILLLIFLATAVHAQVRLHGLERLYFERIAEPGGLSPIPTDVADLLPETLSMPRVPSSKAREESHDEHAFHDFELTARSSKRRLWLRQVVDGRHPRIAVLWWALYDGGRRSDVWRFEAMPDRTDGKMLSNYYLNDVSMPETNLAVFRVHGQMFRPGGAWWVVGKEWTFAVSDSAITLARVRNVFGFFQGYDTGEAPSTLSVSTEQEAGGRYEVRTVDPVAGNTSRACGFRDPMLEESWTFSWGRLLKEARCITSKRGAKVSFRDRKIASFIERDK
jgi:hypothetical protein